MPIMKMKKIHIIGLGKDRKKVLEFLQRRGAVQVESFLQEDDVFSRQDTSASRAIFEKNIASAGAALDILNRYAPAQTSLFSSLEGPGTKTSADYDAFYQKSENILNAVYEISSLDRTVAEKKAEVLQLEAQMEALSPWLSLTVSMRLKNTKRTSVFIGSLPGEMNLEETLALLASHGIDLPDFHLEVISTSTNQTNILAVCALADGGRLEEALRACGFALPANMSRKTPAERKTELTEQIGSAKETIASCETKIKSFADQREQIQFLADYFTMRKEKYEVISQLLQSSHTFVLTGFVPQAEAAAIESDLQSKFDLTTEFSDPDPAEDPPILLKNGKLGAAVSGVLESFGLPGPGEIDPSPVMSIFYYILFGLMFSDAGYGLLLIFGCGWALHKFKNMKPGTRNMIQMFFYCGITTTFWGFMFGTFFGDLVGVVASTFFGRPDIALRPIWFDPVTEPMRMLVFCMLVGIIHLFAGLALQWYQHHLQKNYKDILYDCVFWYMLLIGLIVFALSSEMVVGILQLNFLLPSSVGLVAGAIAGIGAVGIVLTAGRESRNPFKRLLKGAYGLYNVTGYLSDILSYSRLLALGLATGVIGTVVNSMGSMMGGGIGGAIFFIVVFAVGHTLNLAINLLGAYVHTNRLQFVEFFGKFYEGGGRGFKPFAAHTKYYNIKEEISNG